MRLRCFALCSLLLLIASSSALAAPKGKPWSAPAIPARSDAIAAEPNDQCSGAILLPCGNINLSGTTAFALNHYTFTDSATSCTGYLENGRDVVYLVNPAAGDSIWLDFTSSADGAIYIVRDCSNVQGTCVVGEDDQLPNVAEQLRYKFTSAGLYYIILDSYGLDTGGTWVMNGQLICSAPTPPANDICQGATTLPCGAFSLAGSTQYATNNYTLPAGNLCTNMQPADGRDVVYRLNVQAGDSIIVNYTSSSNGSAYIIADCASPSTSCQAGVDATGTGALESFHYRFSFAGTYYLVLDSRTTDSFGTWTATGTLACIFPPPSNDLCSGAAPIYCGTFNLAGETTHARNDYAFVDDASSCTGFRSDGMDVTYRLDVTAGDSLWVNYRSTTDASIYLVTNCANLSTCVAGVDAGVENDTEYFRYRFPSQGTYYLILDSFAAGSFGTWTATGGRICGTVGVDAGAPGRLELSEIQPNPFFGKTRIGFVLPRQGAATLRIYDLIGREVRTLVDGVLPAGRHEASWDGRAGDGHRAGPGVYFARLSSAGQEATRRLIFSR